MNIIRPDVSVIDSINRGTNADFGIEMPTFNARRVTLSGVELMYFTSSALVVKNYVDAFVKHVRSQLDNPEGLEEFEGKAEELNERYIVPLIEKYAKEFAEHNKRIIDKGPTDWNHSYFPDAIYSDKVYEHVKHLLNK